MKDSRHLPWCLGTTATTAVLVGMFGGEGQDPACIAADVLDGKIPLQGEEAVSANLFETMDTLELNGLRA